MLPVRLALDLALAVGLTAMGLLELWVPFESAQGGGSRTVGTLGVLVMTVPLAARRTAPLLTAAVVVPALPLLHAVGSLPVLFWGGFVPIVVATFSVARHGRGREPFVGGALVAGCLLVIDLTVPELQSPSEIVFHWTLLTLVWLSGWSLATMERRARASTQHAIEVEVAAQAQVLSAVVEERARIARELHDIVAHAVSTMVVQAGAAGRVVEDDPELVRRSLDAIRATGSEALAEMRRLVTVMRAEGEPDALAPHPGVAAIPALVEEVRSAGLDVTLETSGRAVPLSPGLDLTVYRIVQESLTNVRRHAAATTAAIRLAYADSGVTVEVTDDGAGTSAASTPGGASRAPGHGLLGIRERVSLYGGTLHVGPCAPPGHGFVVRAELPDPT
ncbi:sensor histidine kinase [Nocardioides sp. HDW12B]|uniref:sensor histidine kinase n=1 Tax=Nocardioides sp. HDW12B TaxID=2714939 RepID=UPI001F0F63C0|nr:sensor histidine kinase [Nocardioides sp. HDW12B]